VVQRQSKPELFIAGPPEGGEARIRRKTIEKESAVRAEQGRERKNNIRFLIGEDVERSA